MQNANSLIHLAYYFCAFLFLVLAFAVFRSFRISRAVFGQVTRGCWGFLIVLFLLAFFVRWNIVPHRHYVFYDEYEHVNIAKNMAEEREFARCNLYLDGACLSSDLPQWTPGYHFLLASAFKVFGTSEAAAYNLNACLGAFSVVVIFLIIYLLTATEAVSLVFALVVALTPLHLKFSGNSSPDMASFLFTALSFLSLLIFSKFQSAKSFFQFIAVTAFTLLVRPENGLILPVFAAWLALTKVERAYYGRLRDLGILFVPYVLYLLAVEGYQVRRWLGQNAHVPVWEAVRENVVFWVMNPAVPVLGLLLAVVGGFYAFKKNKPVFWCSCLYFFAYLFFT